MLNSFTRLTQTYIKLVLIFLIFELVSCDESCSNCLYGESYCDPNTQVCTFGCKPGWKTPSCNKSCSVDNCKECRVSQSGIEKCVSCHAGVYGDYCNLPCSDNCNGKRGEDTCDHFGNCLFGCKAPYKGPQCREQDCPYGNCQRCDVSVLGNTYCWQCVSGYFWLEERQKCVQCSTNCKNGPKDCDSFTGTCAECKDGWFGSRCNYLCYIGNCSQCGHKKEEKVFCRSCNKGMYPVNDGAKCVSCLDRNCNETCNSATGECMTGCKVGWFGEGYLCDRQCIIPHCESCALNYHRNAVCLKCKDDYYVSNRMCAKCPSTCKQSCEQYKSNCVGGCINGYYGDTCDKVCNPHCLNNTCLASTGFCDCEEGWFGYRCDRSCPIHCTDCPNYKNGICATCEPGWHGHDCQIRCNTNCRPRNYGGYIYCDKTSGACEDGCLNGAYGSSCNISCNSNCESDMCDRNTGNCLSGCSQNYFGPMCQFPCPVDCRHVVQGYKRTCNSLNGQCLDGCSVGKYGEFCNQTCSDRCKENMCEQFSGDCSLGCKLGYAGANCDIICANSCPNDCSPNCRNGICDKTTKSCVSGCNTGWYGTTCTDICSDKCVGRICRQIDGFCLGTCLDGFYGPSCNLLCSGKCIDKACNKTTGYCLRGCKKSFHGDMCSMMCAEQCQNGTCNQKTGACLSCGLGKRGDMCDESCEPGTYGENCAVRCGNCRDNVPCNIYNGECLPSLGCEIGYTGDKCMHALYSRDESPAKTMNMDIVIGSSVAGVICLIIFALMILCWLKARKTKNKNKSDEPVVVYRDANVTIERADVSPNVNRDSNCSDTLLLGDSSSRLQINLQQELNKASMFTLYKGQINSAGRQQSCCVKLIRLQDLEDDKTRLSRFLKESELQSLCGSHINVVNLITSYQNTDVYCVALDSSVETGLPQYLQNLQSDDKSLEPDSICKLLQFAIDICSALCHIHKMKVIHKMVQTHHVYLSDTLVAKLGDFYWASHATETDTSHATETDTVCDLPEDSYPWLSPEVLIHHQFSNQSDIWSLGVTLWEIFSLGKLPFHGVDRTEYERMIVEDVRLSKPLIAHLTQYRVMKNCWQYAPEDRPTSDQVLQQLIDIQSRFSDVERVLVHV